MIIKFKKTINSFTLIELLIIVALIVILALVILMTLNPKKQIEKNQDAKRKTELTQLSKVLEDYYNDKNCYPKPEDICYDQATQEVNNTYTCHICGNETTSPDFKPYLQVLPCDPQQPIKKYLYQVDDLDCPSWYKIYARLSNLADPIIEEKNLQNCFYNFGVSSTNTSLDCNYQEIASPTPHPTSSQTQGYCSQYSSLYVLSNNVCNICGSYQQCKQNSPGQTYYIDGGDPNPQNRCKISCIPD